jgi:branched-chain amino acid transport system substrate-binding protein
MLKAGVLYPRSGIYPLLGADFLSGIQSSLAFYNCTEKIQLITVSVGFGSSEQEVYNKVEALLLQEKVDLVIAFLDLKVIRVVQNLFTATGKLFLVVNTGANYPENWVPPAGTAYLTLLDSFLCRLTGILASKNGMIRSLMAASFYDGGYQHCNAMVNGFVGRGGSIEYNYISQPKLEDFDITKLQDFLISHTDIRSILCLFSGKEANMFYERANNIPGAESLQLYVSPAMLEEQNCSALSQKMSFAVHGYIPWHSSLPNNDNVLFRKTVFEQSKREATIFSLLGWEAGLLLHHIGSGEMTDSSGDKMLQLLHTGNFNSPRGSLRTDHSTNYIIGPAYEATWQKDNSILINNSIADISVEWNSFVREEVGAVSSGWLNTYLCY